MNGGNSRVRLRSNCRDDAKGVDAEILQNPDVPNKPRTTARVGSGDNQNGRSLASSLTGNASSHCDTCLSHGTGSTLR